MAYDRVEEQPTAPLSALIDVSGSTAVRRTLRAHLGADLIDTVHVGQTDWDQPADDLLGSSRGTTPFFAPTAIQQLVSEWGPAQFAQRLDADLQTFTAHSRRRVNIDHRDGRSAMAGAFDDVAAGTVRPTGSWWSGRQRTSDAGRRADRRVGRNARFARIRASALQVLGLATRPGPNRG